MTLPSRRERRRRAAICASRAGGSPRAILQRVVLTGGCFQNRYLTERAVQRLREVGFRPYWHQRIPPNDGGIALGQIFVAQRARLRAASREECLT